MEKSVQPEETTQLCENCNSALIGPYCANCGQQAEPTLKYFWTVILHLLDDFFSFDSRANRTLWPLMVKPGFLTAEYFEGRRVHYVPPLRLYLFISIVFFISLNFFADFQQDDSFKNARADLLTTIEELSTESQNRLEGDELVQALKLTSQLSNKLNSITGTNTLNNTALFDLIEEITNLKLSQLKNGELTEVNAESLKKKLTTWQALVDGKEDALIVGGINFGNDEQGNFTFEFLSDDANKKLDEFTKSIEKKSQNSSWDALFKQTVSKLPQLMFVLLPLFAVLLKIFYLFKKRLYLEHLTVALHSHSFIFFAFMLVQIFDYLSGAFGSDFSFLSEVTDYLAIGVLVWIPIYIFIMQKRVYKQGYFMTTLKYSLIGLSYLLLITFTFVAAMIWGVADMPT